MRRIVHITICLICPLLATAQYYIKGQVKDESGHALQNVTILLHSSQYVYASGSEGAFGIITDRKTDTLSFSFAGFERMVLPVDATRYLDVKLHKVAPGKNSHVNKLASLTTNLKRETQQQWFSGDETYASIIENQYINARDYPSTGLTLNVDRASYSNIRRFLNMQTIVPPDAVRIEEMLNYFNLNYEAPPDHKMFGIKTVLTTCPWNKSNRLLIAKISSHKINLDSLAPSHLVFLIDVSGSMDMPNRLPLLKNGFKALVNNLRAKDSVSIVVYGGTIGIALPTTSGGEKEKIWRVIDSLQTGGSTPGESGIKLAYSIARNHFIKGGNNRVILATDGDFNVGLKTEDELEALISKQRQSGIYLTCLGVGMGNYKDSKIQLLAQRGNGNFSYLDNYGEAEKVLLKEFTKTLYTVADNAYLTVKFDSSYVKQYRLIGFDNKVGAIKDTSASIEGGEIGSAYSSEIAFEITPRNPLPNDDDKNDFTPFTFSIQYNLPGKNEFKELTQQPLIHFQQFFDLDSSFQFATAVMMFGGLLRKSKFIKNITWSDVQHIANEAYDRHNFSQVEFMSLIEKAKVIYSKKRKKDE